MQRIDDLQRGGLRIIQDDKGFRFGTDAVLLADFAAIKPGERVCDMGTGTGVLPLLLSARAEGTTFDAFEIQPDVADMASRSVALNGLQERIRVHCADCREAAKIIGHECVQLVVTNPPYTRAGAGQSGSDASRLPKRFGLYAGGVDDCLCAGFAIRRAALRGLSGTADAGALRCDARRAGGAEKGAADCVPTGSAAEAGAGRGKKEGKAGASFPADADYA